MLAKRNAPVILTTLGSVGVVATSVLTAKATINAAHELFLRERMEDRSFTSKEVFKMSWRFYIPTAISAAATIACIVGTHGIHTRRTAALVSLYSFTDAAFREYKDRIVEELGASKEQRISDDLLQERIDKVPVSSAEVHISGRGEVLFYDEMSGRYFKSDVESVRKAVNDINQFVINHGPACLNDLYSNIGLASTILGDEVGWNTDRLLEMDFLGMITDEGNPCIALQYRVTTNYSRY